MNAKLVFSPDDNGYYFERYVWDGNEEHPGYFEESKVYPTKVFAEGALRKGTVKWEKI